MPVPFIFIKFEAEYDKRKAWEEGEKHGEEKGIKEGEEKRSREIAGLLKAAGDPPEKIAAITGLSLADIEKL